MNIKKMLLLLGISVLFSGLFLSCETAPPAAITDARGQNVSGTATGFAMGYAGEVSVTLTVVDGFITDVVARADHDTAMFSGPVIMRAPNDMIRFNTPTADIVSGATVTSMAVNEAARNALDQIIAGQ